ncbi:MAG: flagellar biosynthesis protein FliR [Fusobacteriaceae bacterium]|jgi:flagellar biosynthetic protein FliR|nr:flagellar biosynthesis protein FliR [Fusobacteriales bacterium]MDN5303733.1 flagellar biosynthesis protein FliR [Fusobacteriaceae bacterium]
MENFYIKVIIFLLIFSRIAGIFIVAPVFSHNAITQKVKIGISAFISILLYNSLVIQESKFYNINFSNLISFLIKEMLLGAILGYVILLVFSIVQTASQIYSVNMGLVMASVFDPISQFQIPVLGQIKYLVLMGLFFIYGVHRKVLFLLADTFYKYPIGSLNYNINGITEFLTKLFIYYFTLSIQVAIPILMILLAIDIVLGVMSRIAPQMNVFFIGMPLKIIIGLILLVKFIPIFILYFNSVFEKMYLHLGELIKISLNS